MENASKALIIAGSVLITIMIVTFGIYMYNKGNAVPAAKLTEDEKKLINTFNSKFTRI